MEDRRKVQFWISAEDSDELADLVKESRKSSLSELIRDALSLYAWVVDAVAGGGRLQLVDSEGERFNVVLPGLSDRKATKSKPTTGAVRKREALATR